MRGRIVCIEALINGGKMILCNIYAPNRGDPHFFHKVNKILGEMEGQVILVGDFNEVLDAFLDESKFRGPAVTKDRAAIHMLREDIGLVDMR